MIGADDFTFKEEYSAVGKGAFLPVGLFFASETAFWKSVASHRRQKSPPRTCVLLIFLLLPSSVSRRNTLFLDFKEYLALEACVLKSASFLAARRARI